MEKHNSKIPTGIVGFLKGSLKYAAPEIIKMLVPGSQIPLMVYKSLSAGGDGAKKEKAAAKQEERLQNIENSLLDVENVVLDAITQSSSIPLYCSGVLFFAQDKIDEELQKELEDKIKSSEIFEEGYDFEEEYTKLGIKDYYFGEYYGRSYLALDFSWNTDNNYETHLLSSLNEWIENMGNELNGFSDDSGNGVFVFTNYRVY